VNPAVPGLGVAGLLLCGVLLPGRGGLLLDNLPDLAVDVPPLPHPAKGKKVVAAVLPEAARGFCARSVFVEALPDVDQGEKIRGGVDEESLGAVGFLLLAGGTLPRVLGAEGRRDDEDFPQAALRFGLEDHPGDPGVEG